MALQLIINIDDAGKFSVSGPIDNKMVCYGLLELAKDSIKEHCERSKSLIQPVSGQLAPFPGMKS